MCIFLHNDQVCRLSNHQTIFKFNLETPQTLTGLWSWLQLRIFYHSENEVNPILKISVLVDFLRPVGAGL